MFTPSRISLTLGVAALGLALCLATNATSADGPGLGKPVTEADIAAWDISIEPSGKGLPPGAGTPAQGAHIYVEKCAACHGPEGKAGVTGVTAAPLPPLVGGDPITDISAATKRMAELPRRRSGSAKRDALPCPNSAVYLQAGGAVLSGNRLAQTDIFA